MELTKHVLFVDDEEAIRIVFKRTLQRLGIEVDLAADASAAIELARRRKYAAIVTDFSMPGVTGFTLRDELREFQPLTSFILVSGQLDLKLATDAVNEHGFTGVLEKPWQGDVLHSLINRALEAYWERTHSAELERRSASERAPVREKPPLQESVALTVVRQIAEASSARIDDVERQDLARRTAILDALATNLVPSEFYEPARVLVSLRTVLGETRDLRPETRQLVAELELLRHESEAGDIALSEWVAAVMVYDRWMSSVWTEVDARRALDMAEQDLVAATGISISRACARALLDVSCEGILEAWRRFPSVLPLAPETNQRQRMWA